MSKRHARHVGLISALVAGFAVLAVPASAAQASPKEPPSHTTAAPKPAAQPAAQAAAKKPARGVCASDRDLAALDARVLQTELMVAALSCEERERYNQFATTFQSVLMGRADDLRTFFQRIGGKQGPTRMNALVTRLANDASKESQNNADTYCHFASELFEEVLKTPPMSLNAVTDKTWIRERHGYTACNSSSAQR